jgi:hypothetical protein
MESRIKVAGHPLHPMLIVFPLGLLATAIAFDIAALVSGDNGWFNISFWIIGAGILAGSWPHYPARLTGSRSPAIHVLSDWLVARRQRRCADSIRDQLVYPTSKWCTAEQRSACIVVYRHYPRPVHRLAWWGVG